MTKEEIKKIFEQAKIDWEKPCDFKLGSCENNHTCFGLCNYFFLKQEVNTQNLRGFLEPLWYEFRTVDSDYHFKERGDTKIGRAERLEAINKVLEKLK